MNSHMDGCLGMEKTVETFVLFELRKVICETVCLLNRQTLEMNHAVDERGLDLAK